MTQIQPFNPEDPEIQSNVAYIMMAAPVKNLTEAEVLTTLRLLQLHAMLATHYRGCRDEVIVHRNDKRLELCDDNDRFLAMLLDCDLRDVLLGTKRCRILFGGSVYHWRKIARKCPITDTASAISEYGDGGYYSSFENALNTFFHQAIEDGMTTVELSLDELQKLTAEIKEIIKE